MKLSKRRQRIVELLSQQESELSPPEYKSVETVIKKMESGQQVAENIALLESEDLTSGQRAADKVAQFGGSWTFIIFFATVIMVWMIANVVFLSINAFDPYPFILLNLVLSCLAAIQAPIIMMSQRRQDERDRLEAENDYQVNIKAEMEVREMRETLDRLHAEHTEMLTSLREELALIRSPSDPRL